MRTTNYRPNSVVQRISFKRAVVIARSSSLFNFLLFLVLFLNSHFSVGYCFLTNKLLIAVFTASAAARKTFSSTDTFLPLLKQFISTRNLIMFQDNWFIICRTKTAFLKIRDNPHMGQRRVIKKPCKLETPITIHNNPAEEIILWLVGMKSSPIIETTCKN